MREIRPYGSEGGVALTTPFLPLSNLCAGAKRKLLFGSCSSPSFL